MIPQHARLLFWDVQADTFEPQSYPRFTIGRVLEYGDEEDVRWMRRSFDVDQIVDVLRTDRRLTPLSANFWALHFGVHADEVAALRDTAAGR